MEQYKKYFVNYKHSLKLKEFGFNEECFAWYCYYENHNVSVFELDQPLHWEEEGYHTNEQYSNGACTAPLYQQAIEFLIKKLDGDALTRVIIKKSNGSYIFQKRNDVNSEFYNESDGTNEDCIDKLIKYYETKI